MQWAHDPTYWTNDALCSLPMRLDGEVRGFWFTYFLSFIAGSRKPAIPQLPPQALYKGTAATSACTTVFSLSLLGILIRGKEPAKRQGPALPSQLKWHSSVVNWLMSF